MFYKLTAVCRTTVERTGFCSLSELISTWKLSCHNHNFTWSTQYYTIPENWSCVLRLLHSTVSNILNCRVAPIGFLGGLSLHLNHLIASRVANYNWPFGTLPFGLFGSNFDTRDLETYPRTYSGHFWNMSIFDIPGPFEYFSENGWSQKIKVFSMKEQSLPPYQFSFRRRGP